jgi:hypothetical protein
MFAGSTNFKTFHFTITESFHFLSWALEHVMISSEQKLQPASENFEDISFWTQAAQKAEHLKIG